MASDRQIDANRRNAQKSSGPKTEAGKKRSSGNAYRHGLASDRPAGEAASAHEIELLACMIAGGDSSLIVWANTAAEATFDLARVRRMRVTLIELMALGMLHLRRNEVLRYAQSVIRHARLLLKWIKRFGTTPPEQPIPSMAMPTQEPERTAEAVRRLLPELRLLDRYEQRARSRRDRALRNIRESRILAKRSQFS
jgi:hypothetical protein